MLQIKSEMHIFFIFQTLSFFFKEKKKDGNTHLAKYRCYFKIKYSAPLCNIYIPEVKAMIQGHMELSRYYYACMYLADNKVLTFMLNVL